MNNGTRIRICGARLDVDDRGIIVMGQINPDDLNNLKIDDYQREQLSASRIERLMQAHRTGRVPTVELGMRGDENMVIINDKTSEYVLLAPTYIVDGFQRISAGILVQEIPPVAKPLISVIVHLNTNFDWERKRFDDLNQGQTKLSGNVTLRNLRYDNEVIQVLYKLTTSSTFILKGRVSWDQTKKRNHLITGIMLARTVAMLHSHIGPGRYVSGPDVANGLEKILANTGRNTFIANTKLFFEIVDKCYGIESVAYVKAASHLKLTFMLALARMFSDHTNYWNDAKFNVDDTTIKKLASFPIHDPTVRDLAARGGRSCDHLAYMLAEHVSQGRRTNKLVLRNYTGLYDGTGEE